MEKIAYLLTNPDKLPKSKLDVQDFITKLSKEFGNTIYHPKDLYKIEDIFIKRFLDREISSHAKLAFSADFMSSLTPITSALGIPASLYLYVRNMLLISQKAAIATGIAPNPFKEGITYELSFEESYVDFLELILYGLGVGGAKELTKTIAKKYAEKKAKDIVRKRVSDELITRLAKKIAEIIGLKVTKERISKFVLRTIPILGGGVSGFLSYKSTLSFGERVVARAFEIRNTMKSEIQQRLKISEVLPKLQIMQQKGLIETLDKEELANLLGVDIPTLYKAIDQMKQT